MASAGTSANVSYMRELTARVFVILAAALVCGTLANLFFPGRIVWVENWANYIEAKAGKEKVALVDLKQAQLIAGAGTHVILDARPADDYRRGHLPGAVSLPYASVEQHMEDVQKLLTPAQPIMTYCSGENCDESFLLTLYLRRQGFTNAVLFTGGFTQWKTAGCPIEEGMP
jgi:rhodanese-related sulfurtransferase